MVLKGCEMKMEEEIRGNEKLSNLLFVVHRNC